MAIVHFDQSNVHKQGRSFLCQQLYWMMLLAPSSFLNLLQHTPPANSDSSLETV
jgi:hypothetical protein